MVAELAIPASQTRPTHSDVGEGLIDVIGFPMEILTKKLPLVVLRQLALVVGVTYDLIPGHKHSLHFRGQRPAGRHYGVRWNEAHGRI